LPFHGPKEFQDPLLSKEEEELVHKGPLVEIIYAVNRFPSDYALNYLRVVPKGDVLVQVVEEGRRVLVQVHMYRFATSSENLAGIGKILILDCINYDL
jgi:hypothetical protein